MEKKEKRLKGGIEEEENREEAFHFKEEGRK